MCRGYEAVQAVWFTFTRLGPLLIIVLWLLFRLERAFQSSYITEYFLLFRQRSEVNTGSPFFPARRPGNQWQRVSRILLRIHLQDLHQKCVRKQVTWREQPMTTLSLLLNKIPVSPPHKKTLGPEQIMDSIWTNILVTGFTPFTSST